jgi:cyclopropane fatty-acyl-phospholipid synthase-like methyltransferase
MGWHEHDDAVFHGYEKFFRPSYAANLVASWIPSLQGVKAKLEAGARVADVGRGKGASTVLMAKAFPKSQFFGFDYHDKSIEGARAIAAREGLEVRLNFGVAKAKEFPGKDYDLVTVFDCLHDMGDPVGAATHVRNSLSKDGTWMTRYKVDPRPRNSQTPMKMNRSCGTFTASAASSTIVRQSRKED